MIGQTPMKSFIGFVTISLLCLILTFFSEVRSQNKSVSDSAATLIAEAKYPLAISLLEQSIDVFQDSINFYRLIGIAYFKTLEFDKAIKAYTEAADIENCDTCHRDLDSVSVISLQSKNYKTALKYADKAHKRGSSIANNILSAIHISIGDDNLAEENFEDALEEYEEALNILEDTLAYQKILLCYSHLGRQKDLLTLSEKLLTQFPTFTAPGEYLCEYYYDTGILLLLKGDYQTAISLFNQCLQFDPSKTSEVAIEIGNCYLSLKDTAEALVYYGNALFDPLSSADASIPISNIYLKRNQIESAIRTIQSSLNSFPASPSGWSKLSELYLKNGRRAESIESEKISARLGNKLSQDRLSFNFIPYDSVNLGQFSWLTANPFDTIWNDYTLYDTRLSPPDFIPVDKQPVPVKQVPPEYPSKARKIGIEGTVWVKCLIGKQGNVKRTVILKSDAEIFNNPAFVAATQWKFTPAILRGKPIAVWAAIPFRFTLNK